MRRALAGHLRQMRDGDHLHMAAHPGEHPAHFLGHAARDAGVDLVEDERGHTLVFGQKGLDAEHNAG